MNMAAFTFEPVYEAPQEIIPKGFYHGTVVEVRQLPPDDQWNPQGLLMRFALEKGADLFGGQTDPKIREISKRFSVKDVNVEKRTRALNDLTKLMVAMGLIKKGDPVCSVETDTLLGQKVSVRVDHFTNKEGKTFPKYVWDRPQMTSEIKKDVFDDDIPVGF